MESRNGKYSFWQMPGNFAFIVTETFFFLLLTVVSLIKAIIDEPVFYIFPVFFGLITTLFLLTGLRNFLLRVDINIEREKIIVKGIFGVLTECKIEEITDIYIKDFFKEGTFIVIKDDRQPKNPNNYMQKNCYIRFQHSKERERIVRSFWTGAILTVGMDYEIK